MEVAVMEAVVKSNIGQMQWLSQMFIVYSMNEAG